jgi:hypothetical protein
MSGNIGLERSKTQLMTVQVDQEMGALPYEKIKTVPRKLNNQIKIH